MNKQDYLKKYNSINEILIEWNPLGVDGPVLKEEYIAIIPSLITIERDRNKLTEYFINLLEKNYGVNYSQKELTKIVDKIIKSYDCL
ncbi:MAG: hypothetical protein V4663_15410 [Bacteroidota bacterium]